jgi:alpha-tubulin suppressor-like RCC1 family protein
MVRFREVTCGGYHTCGVTESQTASCWGANSYGQASAPRDKQFWSVSAGRWHTCGLPTNGNSVKKGAPVCWGQDLYAQVAVTSTTILNEISAGGWHTCGITGPPSNRVECWGADDLGQSSPIGRGNAVQVSLGSEFSCSLDSSGCIECWGNNDQHAVDSPSCEFNFTQVTFYSSQSSVSCRC